MKWMLPLAVFLSLNAPVWAQDAGTSPRDAAFDRTLQEVDEPIMWLALAAVLMVIALYGVHRSVFPKK